MQDEDGYDSVFNLPDIFGWPRNKIVFNTVGGSGFKPKRVLKNGKLKMSKPIRNYRQVFGSWYKDEAYMLPWDFENDRITENMVLYAKWK